MFRHCLLAAVLLLAATGASAAATMYTELYGSSCKTIEYDKASGARTRRCPGVAGYRLLVHEVNAQSSIDIVTPAGAVYPLEYWEVVTPGLSRVGRKAQWRVEKHGAKVVPVALLVRLDTSNPLAEGPRIAPGSIITAARIEHDGACVVYQGNAGLRTAEAAARSAAEGRRRKCLGVMSVPSP